VNRCALCPGQNACIPPDGPAHADLLFIGEAPGKDEDKRAKNNPPGRPFIGKTGDEVNRHYLPLAGLRRESVCFTNAIRCLPVSAGGKLDPSRAGDLALLDSCASHHLYPLIERLRPKVIIPLGAFATRAPWGIPAFPMYHPPLASTSRRKCSTSGLTGTDSGDTYEGVSRSQRPVSRGRLSEVTDAEEIDALDPTRPLAGDTESQPAGGTLLFYLQPAARHRPTHPCSRPDLWKTTA
jgi:uracil-DNA glycosylase family 4